MLPPPKQHPLSQTDLSICWSRPFMVSLIWPKDKTRGIFIGAQWAVSIFNTSTELGHPQPASVPLLKPTTPQTTNSYSAGSLKGLWYAIPLDQVQSSTRPVWFVLGLRQTKSQIFLHQAPSASSPLVDAPTLLAHDLPFFAHVRVCWSAHTSDHDYMWSHVWPTFLQGNK